jgi:hypothetical protein
LHAEGKLGSLISTGVEFEGPVHFEEIARRMADANGISKIGSRVRLTITTASAYAVNAGLVKRRVDFLWHPKMEVPVVRERSSLPASSKKLQYTSPEELN